MSIRIGISGFSYADWANGVFYPPGLPQKQWLNYYATQFDTLELNVTYYRVPSLKAAAAWAAATPPGFTFALKAHQSLTHEREAPDFAGFAAALAPLIEAGKLGCVLAQFPPSFVPAPPTRAYLRRLRDGLAGLPLACEFRAAAWVSQDTFALLRSLELGFCCVDEPPLRGLMPPAAVATAAPGYARFHGRNAAQWYNHQHAWQRHDYLYSEAELREWLPRLRALQDEAGSVLVYFNNAVKGKAVTSARMLANLLAE
jgi:uncharacterized protein YecE (DUF72 family)